MPLFSPRHYNFLAAELLRTKPTFDQESPLETWQLSQQDQWRKMVCSIAGSLAMDNPAFKTTQFYVAAGMRK